MAALPVHATEEKARLYRAKIVDNPAIAQLKLALDTWCAIWFWPGDQLDLAPTPKNFAQPPADTGRAGNRNRRAPTLFSLGA